MIASDVNRPNLNYFFQFLLEITYGQTKGGRSEYCPRSKSISQQEPLSLIQGSGTGGDASIDSMPPWSSDARQDHRVRPHRSRSRGRGKKILIHGSRLEIKI